MLKARLFRSIEQVHHITEEWSLQHNVQRLHDAFGGLRPKQFMPSLDFHAPPLR
jgi:putative transposase